LTGDGVAPNGITTSAGIAFPNSATVGDYFLRMDYLPNRLFRYNGTYWSRVEDSVRTNLTPGALSGNVALQSEQTVRDSYVNNTNTYTDTQGVTHTQRQSLSKALTPKADN
jgi:hypothetical protein